MCVWWAVLYCVLTFLMFYFFMLKVMRFVVLVFFLLLQGNRGRPIQEHSGRKIIAHQPIEKVFNS